MSTSTLPTPVVPQGDPAGTGPGADPSSPGNAGGAGTTRPSGRLARALRGPVSDPRWYRPGLIGLLVATALAYLVNLTSAGWANAFYSAAVQAGSTNFEAFVFGSSDAGNSITVDKPPAALWLMVLSVRVLGLNSFAILLPEVILGVATVAVVTLTVKRYFAPGPALLAGAVLALTPVAVLMFRFNNPDALLVLLMALATWATLRAIERGSIRWFALAGVFIGFGFLTKALQVLLVVPLLGIAYLLCADTTLRRRMLGAAAGLGAMIVSAGWWVALIQVIPAADRPYVGGSQDNSFLSVTFGYNGFGRLNGQETGSVGGGGGSGGQWGLVGLGRMFGTDIGGQIAWLLPAALALLVIGLLLRGRAPRTDLRRAAYLVWGGWLVVTGLTFSMMAGIFHQYYTVALAPAIAALVGMGVADLWQRRQVWWARALLAAVIGGSAIWSAALLARSSTWQPWVKVVVVIAGALAVGGLLALSRLPRVVRISAVAAAIVAGLLGPAAYSAQTIATAHSGSIVTAGPAVATGSGPGGRGGFGGAMPGQGGGQFPGRAPGGQGQGGTLGQNPGATGQAPGTTGPRPGRGTGGGTAAVDSAVGSAGAAAVC